MNTRTLLAATLALTTLASGAAMAAEPAAAAKAPAAAATSPMKGVAAHRHASRKAHLAKAAKAMPAKS